MLLGTLLDGATEQRMLIIPDGPLNGVPFAALPLPRSSGQLLLDRFLIGYAPSLALALATPEQPRVRGNARGGGVRSRFMPPTTGGCPR